MRVESAGEVGVSVEEGKRRNVVRKGRLVVGGDLDVEALIEMHAAGGCRSGVSRWRGTRASWWGGC